MIKKMKALLIDDDEVFLILIETYLSKLGISSTLTNNGNDALVLLEQESFDFVITDFQMPVMNGLEILQKINNNEKLGPLKTLLVTGGGVNANELNQAKNIADDYIYKPFSFGVLKEKIESLNLNSHK